MLLERQMLIIFQGKWGSWLTQIPLCSVGPELILYCRVKGQGALRGDASDGCGLLPFLPRGHVHTPICNLTIKLSTHTTHLPRFRTSIFYKPINTNDQFIKNCWIDSHLVILSVSGDISKLDVDSSVKLPKLWARKLHTHCWLKLTEIKCVFLNRKKWNSETLYWLINNKHISHVIHSAISSYQYSRIKIKTHFWLLQWFISSIRFPGHTHQIRIPSGCGNPNMLFQTMDGYWGGL